MVCARKFCENAAVSGLLGSGRFPKSINTGGVTAISFFDFASSSERVFSTPFLSAASNSPGRGPNPKR